MGVENEVVIIATQQREDHKINACMFNMLFCLYRKLSYKNTVIFFKYKHYHAHIQLTCVIIIVYSFLMTTNLKCNHVSI